MTESVSDEGQHRLGNETINFMCNIPSLIHICHTTYYQQRYTVRWKFKALYNSLNQIKLKLNPTVCMGSLRL